MTSAAVDLYGISNCDTVRKARAWLQDHGVDVRFHDYGKAGVDKSDLARWIAALGWEVLVNRRGTTWRRLDAAEQTSVTDATSAMALLLAHPSAIRRPVLEWGSGQPRLSVGFAPDEWLARLRD